jgi:cytochrome c oxidase subunit 2
MKINILPVMLFLMGLLVACSSTIGPEAGQNLSVIKGCSACHAVDETPKIGPSWVGLYGSQVELNDGSFVTADEAYLIESIKEPNARIAQGYTKGAMPGISLSDDELNALVAYIKNVK